MIDWKEREIYADMKAVGPVMMRIDGKGFSKFTERMKFKKPFDIELQNIMEYATRNFMLNSGYTPKFAYTFSDEISIYFDELPFEGRIEKLCSTVASFIATGFVLTALGSTKLDEWPRNVSFDARVVPMKGTPEDLLSYMSWRQGESYRNYVQGYGFYMLQEKKGMSKGQATSTMKKMKNEEVHELCFQMGVNLNDMPSWQRRGIVLRFEQVEREGYNPKTQESVTVQRNELKTLWDIPKFSDPDGREFLANLIK